MPIEMRVPRYFRLIQSWFPSNNWLVQLSLFHDKRGPVWATIKILTDALERHQIDYAVVGGVICLFAFPLTISSI